MIPETEKVVLGKCCGDTPGRRSASSREGEDQNRMYLRHIAETCAGTEYFARSPTLSSLKLYRGVVYVSKLQKTHLSFTWKYLLERYHGYIEVIYKTIAFFNSL